MAIISDNELDHELAKIRSLADALKKNQTVFANAFKTMKPKERAQVIRQILGDQKAISHFIEKTKKAEIYNSGTKFGIENLKQSYQTIMTVWRKLEKTLENSSLLSSGGPGQQNEISGAIDSYAQVLKKLGHNPSTEQLTEFRERLSAAYKTAQEKSGGKDLSVKITEEGGKIKVRMEPKV